MKYAHQHATSPRRRALLHGIAILTSAITSTAWAQTPPPPHRISSLETVVVTAQRRRESAQKTPLVVNVLSSKLLTQEGATDVERVGELVPSVHVDVNPLGGAAIGIRGIVNANPNVGSDPSVAMSVDDIYIARAQAAIASIYDVSRIEVLKGPQGTLYGRNSISGALNIVTNDPVLQKYSGNISAEFGDYYAHTFEGAINVPIGDEVALRLSGETVNHDGYVTDIYNGLTTHWDDEDTQAGRIKLLIQPNDALKAIFSASLYHEGGAGQLSVDFPYTNPATPWNTSTPAFDTTPSGKPGYDDNVYDLSGKLIWDSSPATVTLIAGFTQFDENYIAPPAPPLSFLQRVGRSNQVTTELRVASHSTAAAAGTYSWVGGLFFYQEVQNQFRHVEAYLPTPFGLLFLDQHAGYPHVYAGSAAVFGQGTYAITDHLRATLGLRGTAEAKNAIGQNITTLGGMPSTVDETPSETDRALNYRAELETDVTPNSLLYVSVTTGFHGGGWQDGINALDETYRPEYLTSYEIGSKNEFFDHQLRFNLDGYYYDYKDFLANVNDLQAPTCACNANAPRARAEGVELETQYALTANDIFGLNAAWEDTQYTKFVLSYPFTPQVTFGTQTGTNYNLSGATFPLVSKFSGNVSYTHTFPLENGDTITANVFSQFRTKFYGLLSENPAAYVPASTKTDVNISYASTQRWTITGFVRNIENNPGVQAYGTNVGSSSVATASLSAPRTYGGRLDYSF